jgi:hypothetical protein
MRPRTLLALGLLAGWAVCGGSAPAAAPPVCWDNAQIQLDKLARRLPELLQASVLKSGRNWRHVVRDFDEDPLGCIVWGSVQCEVTQVRRLSRSAAQIVIVVTEQIDECKEEKNRYVLTVFLSFDHWWKATRYVSSWPYGDKGIRRFIRTIGQAAVATKYTTIPVISPHGE